MAKRIKKKVKIKIIPILILLFILLMGFFIFSLLVKIPIKNIYISGNNILSDQEIIELAKIENYPSFIKTTSSRIEKNILKSTYIKSVSVDKNELFKVKIKIIEHKLLFINKSTNMIVIENKEEIKNDKNLELPVLNNYVPDTKYTSLVKNMQKVDDETINKISEITYLPNDKDKDRFLLYMNDGNSVYLTLTKWKQINYYEDVVTQLNGKKGILNLDSGNHFEIFE
ncbi:MAG: FtsQ-type POTRA domain-containing protein [Bacilli bacterium]|nr:FtsQ-type POTRA domain-containing protein [Bacilli bacterium]